MPSKISDIHETAVLLGYKQKIDLSLLSVESKYNLFKNTADEYSNDSINISFNDFEKREKVFDRGIKLAEKIKEKTNLPTKNLKWSAMDNHVEDPSDIYIHGKGISLKDSSKIIRNSGFEQVLHTFCKSPLKQFKDPFWEFAPKLSADFISTIIEDCHSSLKNTQTGLQINIYTKIKIQRNQDIQELLIQNQLRYKHRTFSCAPEANFHLLKEDDWQILYPEF